MVIGCKEDLQKVVDIILRHGPERGLFLSSSKSSVWCPDSDSVAQLNRLDPIGRDIPLITEEGIILLGSPVGSKTFEREANKKRIQKIKDIANKLQLIEDPQVEFALLRSCLSIPKLMFTLRTTDPSNHLDIWNNYDRIVRDCLSRILGASLTN